MLPRWPLPLALAGLLAVPASAANQNVEATPDFKFKPTESTIDQGDSVTWDNNGGFHNVKFDDGSFEQPADPSVKPWTVSRSFDTPGTYRFYCEQHGGPGGTGMSGKVTVLDPDAPPQEEDFTIRTEADRSQNRRRALKFGIRLDEFECSRDCQFTITLRISRATARRLDLGNRARTVGLTMGKHLERFGPKRVDVSVSNAFNKAVKRRPPDERVKVKVVPTAHDTEQRAERARGREFTVTLVP